MKPLFFAVFFLAVVAWADDYHPAPAYFGSGPFAVEGAAGQVTVSATGSGVNALMAHTVGTQGSAVVGWSQSGAPGMLFLQDTHFDSPALVLQRSGSAGNTTSSPTLLIAAGLETSATNMLIRAGGCLALSGDNWWVLWGDCSMSIPLGILDNATAVKGHLSIDPVHRQLVAEDGVTAVLTYTGTSVSVVGHTIQDAAFHAATDFDAAGAAAAAQSASQPLTSNLTTVSSWVHVPMIASASLDYPSVSANSESSLTITVSGAVASHYPSVSLGWSAALPDGIVVKQAWVSADNTVTIRVRNETGVAIDPAAVTCRVVVQDY